MVDSFDSLVFFMQFLWAAVADRFSIACSVIWQASWSFLLIGPDA